MIFGDRIQYQLFCLWFFFQVIHSKFQDLLPAQIRKDDPELARPDEDTLKEVKPLMPSHFDLMQLKCDHKGSWKQLYFWNEEWRAVEISKVSWCSNLSTRLKQYVLFRQLIKLGRLWNEKWTQKLQLHSQHKLQRNKNLLHTSGNSIFQTYLPNLAFSLLIKIFPRKIFKIIRNEKLWEIILKGMTFE